MHLRQLEKLLVVERLSSISKAAEYLQISQSALSKTIAELEEELQIPIFIRTNRGVFLTDTGREALHLMQNIVSGIDNIKLMTGKKQSIKSILRIGLLPAFYNAHAMHLLKEFKKTFPQVDLQLMEMSAMDSIKGVVEGRCDIGMGAFFLNEEEKALKMFGTFGLAYTAIGQVTPKVYMSAQSVLAKKKEIRLKDLENYLLLEFLDESIEKVLMHSQQKGLKLRRFQVYDRETMKQLISLDYGVAFLPRIFECDDKYMENGMIIGRRISDYPQKICYYLLYPQQGIGSPLASELIVALMWQMREMA